MADPQTPSTPPTRERVLALALAVALLIVALLVTHSVAGLGLAVAALLPLLIWWERG